MHMIAGVDEAGRGPFIGPMVMACVAVGSEDELPDGLTDSKLLSAQRREQLYEQIIKLPHAIRVCRPAEIDEWVFEGKLNWLEAEKTAEMLNELSPEKAYIDCPSRNPELYGAYIEERAPGIELVVEHKADLNYAVSSAASILAKVTRDRLVAQIRQEAGFDFGSGYLTDPKTQAFLKDFDQDFPHFRKSWATYQKLLKQKEQQTLF